MIVDLSSALVITTLLYTARLVLLSRRARTMPVAFFNPDLLYVFVIPCLNEERVIETCLQRLLALPSGRVVIMVVDDGSDDATAAIVRRYASSRVWLFRRTAPYCRQGKGEALNAAYRFLRETPALAGWDHRDVIVSVLDADGRLAPTALAEVSGHFADPRVGGVQVGVRMYNARESLLARLQDVEFVTYTEIFQRARQRIGSVGLGGNGQFNRLAALESLGSAPWTDCLTEDLDLGIQLLLRGWTNAFCPTSHVSQQAVTDLRRLFRQRSRWFQGHLQTWRRIPEIARSRLPLPVVADLVYHLVAASLVLVMTVVTAVFLATLGLIVLADPRAAAAVLTADGGLAALLLYLLAFGMSAVYAVVYWLRTPDIGLFRALLTAHAFALYAYLWVPAGWRAVLRVIGGRRDWAKTTRTLAVVEELFAR